MSSKVLKMLKREWNAANTNEALTRLAADAAFPSAIVRSKPTRLHTKSTNGCSNTIAHVTPMTFMAR